MDPLSISVASLSILNAVASVGNGLNSLKDAPAEVLALENEVSSCSLAGMRSLSEAYWS